MSGVKDAQDNLAGNKTDKGKLMWQRVLKNTLAYDLDAHASVLLRAQGEFKPVLVRLLDEKDTSVKLTKVSYKRVADNINKTAAEASTSAQS